MVALATNIGQCDIDTGQTPPEKRRRAAAETVPHRLEPHGTGSREEDASRSGCESLPGLDQYLRPVVAH